MRLRIVKTPDGKYAVQEKHRFWHAWSPASFGPFDTPIEAEEAGWRYFESEEKKLPFTREIVPRSAYLKRKPKYSPLASVSPAKPTSPPVGPSPKPLRTTGRNPNLPFFQNPPPAPPPKH